MLNPLQPLKDSVRVSIDKLVRDYNIKYSRHPIIVFQFVSLDATSNKNLIWWSHDQEEITDKYNNLVTEFIGKEKVERTLVTWEYDGDAYRYAPFGKGKILQKVDPQKFKQGITPDKIDLETAYQIIGDKTQMLFHWESLLQNEFINGSTMWISLPHTDNLNRLIYSSVFVLFNTRLPEKENKPDKKILLESYRLFRNFIVQYLIDHYRRPLIESKMELIKELAMFESSPNTASNYFRPIGYNVSGKIITKHLKGLEDKYFGSENYFDDFILIKEAAFNRIKSTYNSSKHLILQENSEYQDTYTIISKIHIGDKEKFKFFLYGRFMILIYHLVFEYSLKLSWHYLINHKRPSFDFTELQRRFAISGLRNDIESATRQLSPDINLHKVVPSLSDAEFRLLLDVCSEYKKSFRWSDLIDARTQET
ncbi:MAG: hypothetical protein R3A50_16560 [Saprospiraceae bacterium]